MTVSNDISTTEQRIADLRAILSLPPDQIVKAKGSMIERWEGILAGVLADPSPAVEQEVETSRGRLPARVLAPAAVQAWALIPLDRRKNYLHWIDGLEADKQAIHRITLAVGLLQKDPETSQSQIIAVSLNSKKNVTRLAEELLNRHSLELSGILPRDAPLYKVLKVAQCLIQVAGHERSDPNARYNTLRTVLLALNQHLREGKSVFTAVFESIGKVLDALPGNLQRQIAGDLQESAPELHARFFPNLSVAAVPASPQPESKADGAPTTNPFHSVASSNAVSVSTAPAPHQAELRIDSPQLSPVEPEARSTVPDPALTLIRLFEEASQHVHQLKIERERLSTDLSVKLRQAEAFDRTLALVTAERGTALERLAEAGSSNAALTSRIAELTNLLHEAESQSTLLNVRVAELMEEKQRLLAAASEDKEALRRQVQGTAQTRVEELKNDIAFAVGRVVRDVPDKSAKLNPDSGQRMFIRLHEVVSELERRGIRVRGK